MIIARAQGLIAKRLAQRVVRIVDDCQSIGGHPFGKEIKDPIGARAGHVLSEGFRVSRDMFANVGGNRARPQIIE